MHMVHALKGPRKTKPKHRSSADECQLSRDMGRAYISQDLSRTCDQPRGPNFSAPEHGEISHLIVAFAGPPTYNFATDTQVHNLDILFLKIKTASPIGIA